MCMWRADLLSEQRHLPGIFRNSAAMAPGCADYRKHSERFERAPWHKQALRVRPQVGRINEEALGGIQRKIVGHHAFKDFVVLEPESDPEPLGAGPSSESLAAGGVSVPEFADEIDDFDIFKIDCDHITRGIEQF